MGLRLESPTWRANPDWAAGLGYDAAGSPAVNRASIGLVRGIGERWADRSAPIELSGQIGPRGDGYRPGVAVDPDEAAEYHRPQIAAFAEAGADVTTALTLTDTGEALGVVAPPATSASPSRSRSRSRPTGKLPTGKSLMEAIAEVDADGGPDYFLVNCAHPEHVERGLGMDGFWRDRVPACGSTPPRAQPRGARRDDRAGRRRPRRARGRARAARAIAPGRPR